MPTAVVKFLASDSHTKIVAKPQLRGAEGTKLTMNLGDEIPVLSTVFGAAAAGGFASVPQSSFNYRTVGVNLEMTPRVTYEARSCSTGSPSRAARSAPNISVAGQDVPSFASRKVTTKLRLREGESTLLAGLLRDEQRKILTGFPGHDADAGSAIAVRPDERQINQSDIVMLLTPHIVRTHELTVQDLSSIYHRHAAEHRPWRAAAAHCTCARGGAREPAGFGGSRARWNASRRSALAGSRPRVHRSRLALPVKSLAVCLVLPACRAVQDAASRKPAAAATGAGRPFHRRPGRRCRRRAPCRCRQVPAHRRWPPAAGGATVAPATPPRDPNATPPAAPGAATRSDVADSGADYRDAARNGVPRRRRAVYGAGVDQQRVARVGDDADRDIQPERAARAHRAGRHVHAAGRRGDDVHAADRRGGRPRRHRHHPDGDQAGASGAGLLAALLFDAVGPGGSLIQVSGVASTPEGAPVAAAVQPGDGDREVGRASGQGSDVMRRRAQVRPCRRLHVHRAARRHDDPADPGVGGHAAGEGHRPAQRETELHRALREMRTAIDKYKDAVDNGLIGSIDVQGGQRRLSAGPRDAGRRRRGGERRHRAQAEVPAAGPDRSDHELARNGACDRISDKPDSTSWGGQNVYDVYSKSKANGARRHEVQRMVAEGRAAGRSTVR